MFINQIQKDFFMQTVCMQNALFANFVNRLWTELAKRKRGEGVYKLPKKKLLRVSPIMLGDAGGFWGC